MYERTNKKKEETFEGSYKVVEAMYRKGCSNEAILLRLPDVDRLTVCDMIQTVFARDQIRKGRP